MSGVTSSAARAQRAILLLAGRGRRLGDLTAHRPKCMIDLAGTPILERSLQALGDSGVREAVLVVGYRSEEIRALASDAFGPIHARYVVNERYAETNTAYSLWLAREYMDESVLLVEGDIVFEAGLIEAVIGTAAGESAWAALPIGPRRDEGILLGTDSAGRVRQVDLVRNPEDRIPELSHKCAGIQVLSAPLARAMARRLDEVVAEGRTRVFADLVLGGLVGRYTVNLCLADGHPWAEVDDVEDLLMAERVFSGHSGLPGKAV